MHRYMRIDRALLRCKRLMREAWCENDDQETGSDPCWLAHRRGPELGGDNAEWVRWDRAERAIADGREINTWKGPYTQFVGSQNEVQVYRDFTDYCWGCRRKERLFRHRTHLTRRRKGALQSLRSAWRAEHPGRIA